MMKSRIRKWGNSLAIRIPKSIAKELRLSEKSYVRMSISEGKILIRPIPYYELDDLLAQISDENKHGEIDMGKGQGNEAI
jgi:antitoxin MazE